MQGLIAVIANLISQFLLGTGFFGLFLALAVEAACIPITSEVFLLFAGYLVGQGKLSYPVMVAGATLGFVFGAFLPYYVGRRHGELVLGRGGRFFFASERELEKVEKWFERHGQKAIIFGRYVPLVRDFISLPAGHYGMPPLRFALYTAVGILPWSALLIHLGRVLGSNWQQLVAIFQTGNRYVLWGLLVLAGLLVVRRIAKVRQ